MYSPCEDVDKLGAGWIYMNLSEPLFGSFQLGGKSFMQPTCNLGLQCYENLGFDRLCKSRIKKF